MQDKGRIFIGLGVFLVLITFPIWYNSAGGKANYRPEVEIETKNVPGKDQCVMDTEYMTTSHMNLLDEWRDKAVRAGDRIHEAPDGRKYDRSLTRTCMECHSNKKTFCDRCHDYVDVNPYCWDCHIEPQEIK